VTTPIVDLTPFGFTLTESRVYDSLLALGPSTGYAVAGALGIARANAYQAILSLTAKGIVATLPGRPVRVRAAPPDGLLALLVTRQGQRLERLDQQLQQRGTPTTSGETVVVQSQRALDDLATRIIVREEGLLETVAPMLFFASTGPAWRKRAADGRLSRTWATEDGSTKANQTPAAELLPLQTVVQLLGSPAVILAGDRNALVATAVDGKVRGWWAQDQLSIGLARSAIATVSKR